MAKTREKILNTALRLFNEEGTNEVTPRRIAIEMGISHGNLRYHFSKKEEILYGLYMQLVASFDEAVDQAQRQPDLKMAYDILKTTFEKLYTYRFLMIDFVSVMRQVEAIRIHYQALFQTRHAQFRQIFQALEAEGILQPEMLPGQYERFMWQMNIFSDFWVGASEIHFSGLEEDRIDFFAQIAFSMLYPYLTEKGRKAYLEVIH